MSSTMQDVAREAGVSTKTVSRVVNDEGGFSEATRLRVRRAIEELGYRPNLVARGLKTRRSGTVGLVVGNVANPFFSEVAQGLQEVAREHGYHVYLCDSQESGAEELRTLQTLAAQGVDGIIIFPNCDTGDNLPNFASWYGPLVVVNHAFEHPKASSIMTQNRTGAWLAVEYLAGQGHREIGMLSALGECAADQQRVHGFRDTLESLDLPANGERIVAGRPTSGSGRRAALRLLQQSPQITALFAHNDLLAVGALRACKELGRRVPEDCSVVGFDDIRLASQVCPALTTIRIDKQELGQQAMTRLMAMLAEPEATFPPLHLGVELVVRESA